MYVLLIYHNVFYMFIVHFFFILIHKIAVYKKKKENIQKEDENLKEFNLFEENPSLYATKGKHKLTQCINYNECKKQKLPEKLNKNIIKTVHV